MGDTVIEGLRTTALGMGVVFAALGALYCVLRVFEWVAVRGGQLSRKRDQVRSSSESAGPVASGPAASSEIAAVIACVLALEGDQGDRVRVKSVTRSSHRCSALLEEGTEA